MIDFTKLLCDNQHVVQRLYTYCTANLQPHKPQNRFYTCFSNGSALFRLEFRNVSSAGKIIGYRHVEICFSPHYIYNNFHHNGNDLTPNDCIKTINQVFAKLWLKSSELEMFRVVGIEFGVNIQLENKIEDVIAGFKYFKTKPFMTPHKSFSYFKTSNTTGYKVFKVYAKGLQFYNNPEYGINRNTLRLEIKSKQAKNISKYGIYTARDFLDKITYAKLYQELLNELDYILIVNSPTELSGHTADEQKLIANMNDDSFIRQLSRVKFARMKEKYYKTLGSQNNLHLKIKGLLIDKIFSYQHVTFSTLD